MDAEGHALNVGDTARERPDDTARSRPPGSGSVRRSIVARARSTIFILKALPATSKVIDAVTLAPIVESFTYATHFGGAEAQLYLPRAPGPHPAVVVSLGVVPEGIEHPQTARFAQALSRAGFAAMLHWSPALRDLRLAPLDVADLTSAYSTLMDHPSVDATRSGLLGTCIGGSLALMASADVRIRDRLAFVSAYAPFASMWTLARDIASATRTLEGTPEPWLVDPLAWSMFVRSVTSRLDAQEADLLRAAFEDRFRWDPSKTTVIRTASDGRVAPTYLSPDGAAVYRLLLAGGRDDADVALHALPSEIQALLTALSPITRVRDIRAPLITLLHDRRDHLIPVSESRQLWAAMSGRVGAHYTELGFQHLDPTRLPPFRLVVELSKLYRAVYPLFRVAAE